MNLFDRSSSTRVLRLGAKFSLPMLMLVAGCLDPVVKNGPLVERRPDEGYRFRTLQPGPGNSDDVFVCLCFSGGGTRAAALSYGVLKALRETPIKGSASKSDRTLLDEVDVITSVSGGSFTAMSYGLDRDEMFTGGFERKFLKQNIQNRLLFLLLRPRNLLLLPYVLLDRIDIVGDYYDRAVFDRRTYRDLVDRGDRPYLVINATNMALGKRFEFTQDDFDLLGSDLATLPVSHAVAASSAFPLLFSPLRLKYYPGAAADAAIAEHLTNGVASTRRLRRYLWASSLTPEVENAGDQAPHTLDGDRHRFLYLLDGGLTDNLGITYVVEELRFGVLREMVDAGRIKHLVVIIVDANTNAPEPIEHLPSAPGLLMMAEKTGTTSMYNYSEAMTDVLRFMLRDYPERLRRMNDRCRESISRDCPTVELPPDPPALTASAYLVEVNLHRIVDPKTRKRFLSMPTSLFLTAGDVDGLVEMGRSLVESDPDFQKLLRMLNN